MEIEEKLTASVDEQIEAVEGMATSYNLRPRPRIPDAHDAAFLTIIRGEIPPAPAVKKNRSRVVTTRT